MSVKCTKMCMSLSALVASLFVFTCVDAARILAVFSTPSISHQIAFRPLTQELARRGHEVVVITPNPAFPKGKAPANLTEIDMHDYSYTKWKEFVEKMDGSSENSVTKLEFAFSLLIKIFVGTMETKEVSDIVFSKDAKFDLLLAEACVRPAFALSEILNVPVILMSSYGSVYYHYELAGAPSHPLIYPSFIRDRLYKLTLWEKVAQFYKEIQFYEMVQSIESQTNAALKQLFGSNTPEISELNKNVDMLFVNVHPIWEDNRPVPPNVVFMGSIHLTEPKQLPGEIQSYLDSSKNGVIYISFGTNVDPSSLPPEKIQTIIKVFAQLPYDVLWKWDQDELLGRSKNIKIMKWLPQADLLRHPKVKLFITQGGLQSADEAIAAGVPLIGMPIFGDQWYNVEKFVRHKIGIRLDFDNLNEHNFKEAVTTILQDKSYRDNVIRLREIMMDQPQQPLERATWWAEYVIRHRGARHLRPIVADMSWTEFLEADLICLLAAFIVLNLVITYVFGSYVYGLLRGKLVKNKKSKKQ